MGLINVVTVNSSILQLGEKVANYKLVLKTHSFGICVVMEDTGESVLE